MNISPDTLRRATGRKRTGREGRGLENLVLASQSLDVILTHVGQAARRIGGGEVLAVRGICDFVGVYRPGARMMFFDAKECRHEHRLDTNEKVFADHQRLQIIRYGEMGAIAGLLAERTFAHELYWCNWNLFLTRRPSIPWSELAIIGSSKYAVRWSEVVAAAEKASVAK